MSMRRGVSVFTFCTIFSFPAFAAIPAQERQVLLDLYTSTNGAGWSDNTGWNGDAGTECGWFGVTCGIADHVTNIDLTANNLVGTLPAINALNELVEIGVAGNTLSGTLPSLSGLTSLQTVYFHNNHFTGSIPSLAGLTSLKSLYLTSNQLTGTIPSLSGLASLDIVTFANNSLSGPLPDLAGLTTLRDIDFSNNQLTGPIPPLSNLTNLTGFAISYNSIGASVPPLPSSLVTFLAVGCNLMGELPDLSNLHSLALLWISNNQLTGSVPDLSNLQSLVSLVIDHNQFSGILPNPPASLPSKRAFVCPNNSLDPVDNPAWDIATGETPWWMSCDRFFANGFE